MTAKRVNWVRLILLVLLCQGAGIVGAFFTTPAISSWYVYLNRPGFTPPSWLFGPVWTLLYLLMGISLYLVWQNKKAVRIFLAQLVFNSLWSIVFFGLKDISSALLIIITLLILLVLTMMKFYKVNKTAAWLLVPYLLWGSFATILNYSFWILNK